MVTDDLTELAKTIAPTLEPDEVTLMLDDTIAEHDPFPMPFAKAWATLVDRGLRDDVTGARTDLGEEVARVLAAMNNPYAAGATTMTDDTKFICESPGKYTLQADTGRAVVERSSLSDGWWWAAWADHDDAAGWTPRMVDAQGKAIAALRGAR